MMLAKDLVKLLEKEYPDKASELKTKNKDEIIEYLAKLELIEYIKLIITKEQNG